FAFLRQVTLRSSLIVPIIGIMLGAVVSSVSTFVALQFDALQNLGVWFAGSFTSVLRGQYEVLWVVALVGVAVFMVADRLSVAGVGEAFGANVVLDYQRGLLMRAGLVAVATGVVTEGVGNLPLLCMIVPHMVSMVRVVGVRSDLPGVALLDFAIVLLCDRVAR